MHAERDPLDRTATADPPRPIREKTILPALWFDVEDLFVYAATTKRPSGIQRLAFEIYREVWERLGTSKAA